MSRQLEGPIADLPLAEIITAWMPWWLFAPIAGTLVAVLVFLSTRDRRSAGPMPGIVLTSLRVTSALLFLVVLLDLTSVRRQEVEHPRELLVVLDTSRSMAIRDAVPSREAASDGLFRRVDRARELLRENIAQVESRFLVTQWTLGAALEELGDSGTSIEPDARVTDLSSPLLEEVLRRPKDAVAAIVLASDGNHNAAGDPLLTARTLGSLGVPVFTLGVGSESSPENVALLELFATGRYLAGDGVRLELHVAHPGYGGLTTNVSLRDGEELVGDFLITFPEDVSTSVWPLEVPMRKSGRRRLSARIDALPGEAASTDNEISTWVDIGAETIRALLVDGGPRWEFRYLESAWERDERIELVAQHAANAPDAEQLPDVPRDRAGLYGFDIIVLGDVSPDAFAPDFAELLVDFVEARGGALVLASGPRWQPRDWTSTALERVLPIELLEPRPAETLGARLARDGPRLRLTEEGLGDALTRLTSGDARNARLWNLLPPPRWFQPIAALRPGATRLVDVERGSREVLPAGDATPVLVRRLHGLGQVLWLGIDSTWRWRFRYGDLLYSRFWSQVARQGAAGGLPNDGSGAVLRTDRESYSGTETIRVSARLAPDSKGGESEGPESIDCVVSLTKAVRDGEDREHRIRLRRVPRSAGRYIGELPASEVLASFVGSRDRVESSDGSDDASLLCQLSLEGSGFRPPPALPFTIERQLPDEGLDLTQRATLLAEIAGLSGGRSLPGRHSPTADISWADVLPSGSRAELVTTRRRLLDYPLLLALLALLLLVGEQLLRKRLDLP